MKRKIDSKLKSGEITQWGDWGCKDNWGWFVGKKQEAKIKQKGIWNSILNIFEKNNNLFYSFIKTNSNFDQQISNYALFELKKI